MWRAAAWLTSATARDHQLLAMKVFMAGTAPTPEKAKSAGHAASLAPKGTWSEP